MADENVFLWQSFRLGVVLCFVYDLLRIWRRVRPRGHIRVAVEDLTYWGWVTVRVFLLLYRESDGTLRWFAVLGALTGMLLYHYLIGRRLVRTASGALRALTGAVGRLKHRISGKWSARLKLLRSKADK